MMRRLRLIMAAICGFVLVAAAGLGMAFFGVSDGGDIATRVATIGGPFTLVDDTGKPVTEKTLAVNSGAPAMQDSPARRLHR
jgi:cytochrome oxidase Cu insertion factor (SCO1/SenC/PrrC family)